MDSKKIVIKVQGGIGNQMFQFAYYTELESKGYDVSLDLFYYQVYQSHNGFEIDKIFENLKFKIVSDDFRSYLSDLDRNFLSRLRRKFSPKKSHYIERIYSYDFNHHKIEYLIRKSDIYLDGYWEDERYFKSVIHNVRKLYSFPSINEIQNINLYNDISNTLSISLHVRRGDKVKSKLHRVQDLNYYLEAINTVKGLVGSNLTFFVFSDDVDWVKDQFSFITEDFRYVNWNTGKKSFRDMQLMSVCQHNIIAASTFSWWAAYLNNNPNKVVIAPSKMFNDSSVHLENKGFIPSSWIKI